MFYNKSSKFLSNILYYRMIEYKLIDWNDRLDIKEVLDTRTYMMGNKTVPVNEKFYRYLVEDRSHYEKNYCFGLYEDGKIDTFSHIKMWAELPIYSITMIFSKKKPNRSKYENGYDINLTLMSNYKQKFMEDKGYYFCYTQRSIAETWKNYEVNEHLRLHDYVKDVVETIPAGEYSKYASFRMNHLGSFTLPMGSEIISYFLPPEKRKTNV